MPLRTDTRHDIGEVARIEPGFIQLWCWVTRRTDEIVLVLLLRGQSYHLAVVQVSRVRREARGLIVEKRARSIMLGAKPITFDFELLKIIM